MAGTRGRRWAVGLLVVDVVLLAVFGALAVHRFQGTPTGTSTSLLSTVVAGDVVELHMPSGNVACRMDSTGVVCGMKGVRSWPAVTGCLHNHVVLLDGTGARAVCATEVAGLAEGQGRTDDYGGVFFPGTTTELAYGQSKIVGDYRCESRQAGILCHNAAGQWFNLRMLDGFTKGGTNDDSPS